MVAFVVCPLASDSVKSGGPLSPQPAKVSGKTHITAVTREIHRPRLRKLVSCRLSIKLSSWDATFCYASPGHDMPA
jgi:hypothetical protein